MAEYLDANSVGLNLVLHATLGSELRGMSGKMQTAVRPLA